MLVQSPLVALSTLRTQFLGRPAKLSPLIPMVGPVDPTGETSVYHLSHLVKRLLPVCGDDHQRRHGEVWRACTVAIVLV